MIWLNPFICHLNPTATPSVPILTDRGDDHGRDKDTLKVHPQDRGRPGKGWNHEIHYSIWTTYFVLLIATTCLNKLAVLQHNEYLFVLRLPELRTWNNCKKHYTLVYFIVCSVGQYTGWSVIRAISVAVPFSNKTVEWYFIMSHKAFSHYEKSPCWTRVRHGLTSEPFSHCNISTRHWTV